MPRTPSLEQEELSEALSGWRTPEDREMEVGPAGAHRPQEEEPE